MSTNLENVKKWALLAEEDISSLNGNEGVDVISNLFGFIDGKEKYIKENLKEGEKEEALVMSKYLREFLLYKVLENNKQDKYIKEVRIRFEGISDHPDKWDCQKEAVRILKEKDAGKMFIFLKDDRKTQLSLDRFSFDLLDEWACEKYAQNREMNKEDAGILFATLRQDEFSNKILSEYADSFGNEGYFSGPDGVIDILREYYPIRKEQLEAIVNNCKDFDELKERLGRNARKSQNKEVAACWKVKEELLGKWMERNILPDKTDKILEAYKAFGSFGKECDKHSGDIVKKLLLYESNYEFLNTLSDYKGEPKVELNISDWNNVFIRFQRLAQYKDFKEKAEYYKGLLYLSLNEEQREKVLTLFKERDIGKNISSRTKMYGDLICGYYKNGQKEEVEKQCRNYLHYVNESLGSIFVNEDEVLSVNKFLDSINKNYADDNVMANAITMQRGNYSHLDESNEPQKFKEIWKEWNQVNDFYGYGKSAFLRKLELFEIMNEQFKDEESVRGKLFASKKELVSNMCSFLRNPQNEEGIKSFTIFSSIKDTKSIDYGRCEGDFFRVDLGKKTFGFSLDDIRIAFMNENINEKIDNMMETLQILEKNHKLLDKNEKAIEIPYGIKYHDLNGLINSFCGKNNQENFYSLKEYKDNHNGFEKIEEETIWKIINSTRLNLKEKLEILDDAHVKNYESKTSFYLTSAQQEALYKQCATTQDKVMFCSSRDCADPRILETVGKQIRRELGDGFSIVKNARNTEAILHDYEGKPLVTLGEKGVKSVIEGLEYFGRANQRSIEKLSYFDYKKEARDDLYDYVDRALHDPFVSIRELDEKDFFDSLCVSADRFDDEVITSLMAERIIEMGKESLMNEKNAKYFIELLKEGKGNLPDKLREVFGIENVQNKQENDEVKEIDFMNLRADISALENLIKLNYQESPFKRN